MDATPILSEITERRQWFETIKRGRVIRWTRRYYRFKNKIVGVLRTFDGREEDQGFFVSDGKNIQGPMCRHLGFHHFEERVLIPLAKFADKQ